MFGSSAANSSRTQVKYCDTDVYKAVANGKYFGTKISFSEISGRKPEIC